MPPDVEDSGPQPLLFVALMVALSTAASTFSGSTPMLAAFLGQEWHYSPADVGWTVTVFTLGTTLGAVAVAGAIRGWRVRRILWLGMVLTVLSNGLLALHPALPAALALNLISGLGSGAVNSVAVGYLVYGPTPHRDLAALTVTQSLFAAFLLQAVIPHFVDGAQASSLFVLMALVMLVAVPAAQTSQPHAISLHQPHASLGRLLHKLPHPRITPPRVHKDFNHRLRRRLQAHAHGMKAEQNFGR